MNDELNKHMFVLHQINLKYQNKKMLFLLYQSKVKQREII